MSDLEHIRGLLSVAQGLSPETVDYQGSDAEYLSRKLLGCLVEIVHEQQQQIDDLRAALYARD